MQEELRRWSDVGSHQNVRIRICSKPDTMSILRLTVIHTDQTFRVLSLGGESKVDLYENGRPEVSSFRKRKANRLH